MPIPGTPNLQERLKVVRCYHPSILPQESIVMPGILFCTFSIVLSVLFFVEPAIGAPPAPADTLKIRPPHRAKDSSSVGRLKGLKQRLTRKRHIEKQPFVFALESLPVPRSPMDNMPIVNPGAGFAFNMPIARPDPNIDYKLRIFGTQSVPYVVESIRPESRKSKPK